jgi:uncharacterized protein YdaU (DUF1376 family)
MSRPWMPLYWGDYHADTRHLTGAQHGAYLLLMGHYWQRGGLPDDDAQLWRIAACSSLSEWQEMRPVIEAFFEEGWRHKRIEEEFAKASAARVAGIASAEARRKRTEAQRNANDPPNETPTERQPLQPQPHLQEIHGGGHAREPDHFNLTVEIGRVCGFADASHWPPGWAQAPLRVRTYLDQGWQPEIMLAAARAAIARKRDGPPSTITYFEKPFARAHAEQSAPLPTVEISSEPERLVVNGRQNTSALAVVRAIQREVDSEPDRDFAVRLSQG